MFVYIFKYWEVNCSENIFDEFVFEEIWLSIVLCGWYIFLMKVKIKENGEIKLWKLFWFIGKLFWYFEYVVLL